MYCDNSYVFMKYEYYIMKNSCLFVIWYNHNCTYVCISVAECRPSMYLYSRQSAVVLEAGGSLPLHFLILTSFVSSLMYTEL